jgi:hypothetical protein
MDIGKQLLLFGEGVPAIDVDDLVARRQWFRDDMGAGDSTGGAIPWPAIDLVVDQIVIDRPPAVWVTAQRLARLGMARRAVLENLAMAALSVGLDATAGPNGTADHDGTVYADALERLPVPEAAALDRLLLNTTRELQPVPIRDLVGAVLRRRDSGRTDALAVVAADVAFRRAVARHELAIVGGGLVVEPATLTTGIVLTTRLAPASVDAGQIVMDDDLAGFARLAPDLRVVVARGTPVDGHLSRLDGRVVLVLPDGSLGRLAAFGDRDGARSRRGARRGEPVRRSRPVGSETGAGSAGLPIAVRVSANRMDLEPFGSIPVVDDLATKAVRLAYDDEVARTGLPPSYENIVLGLLARDVHWFDVPRPPLSDLCRAAGLTEHGSSLAHDPALWAREVQRRLVSRLTDRLPSESDRDAALAVLASARRDASREDAREALTRLRSSAVLAAVVEELLDDAGADVQRLSMDSFAERLLRVARTPRDELVPRWLAARSAEQLGRLEVAEEQLRLTIEADPNWVPAIERLAWYSGDRGDARRAAALWRQAGLADHAPELAVLLPFLPPPGPLPARRSACWCGSGKPFARCHRDRWPVPAVADRAGWLYQKAVSYLCRQGAAATSARRLVSSALAGSDEGGQARYRYIDDPLAVDLALHELGWFDRFLRTRARLLPPDEGVLGQQWTSVPRRLFRVGAVDRAAGILRLEDRSTGDAVDARDPAGGDRWVTGSLLCARVLHDGAHRRTAVAAFGVSPAAEAAALEILEGADGVAIARFARSERDRPLMLTNEREPLVDCLAVLAVVDAPSVRRLLDRRYSRRGPGLWVEEHELAGGQTILRARLRLHESRLRIDARSEARLDRVLDELSRDLPDLKVIWDRRDPVTAPRRAREG